MSKLLTFETGSEYPIAYTNDLPCIPYGTIIELSANIGQNTYNFLSDTALDCNLVRNAALTVDKETNEHFMQAFIDGGIVAVGVGRIGLAKKYDETNDALSTIEELLCQTIIVPSSASTAQEVLDARQQNISTIVNDYGFAAERIIGALKLGYANALPEHIKERQTVGLIAALGFAVITPAMETATIQYRRFLGELGRITEK